MEISFKLSAFLTDIRAHFRSIARRATSLSRRHRRHHLEVSKLAREDARFWKWKQSRYCAARWRRRGSRRESQAHEIDRGGRTAPL